MTVAAYLPAFRAGFIWQDDENITQNPLLRSTTGLWRIWTEPGAMPRFQPLTYTSFWVQHALWGNDPAGYHAVSVALHVANVLLLWTLLRRLLVPGAWLAAALFALHPVQAQTVAWVSQQGMLLAMFFFLSALQAYIRWSALMPDEPDWEERSWRFGLPDHPVILYSVTLLLAAAAFLSHPAAGMLPLAAALVAWWKTGRLSGRDLWPLLPFLLLAGAAVLLCMVALAGDPAPDDAHLQPAQRLFAAAGAVWVGLLEFAVPRPAGFTEPGWPFAPRTGLAYLLPFGLFAAALITVTAILWRSRQRFGVGLLAAWVLFASMHFFGAATFGDEADAYFALPVAAAATVAALMVCYAQGFPAVLGGAALSMTLWRFRRPVTALLVVGLGLLTFFDSPRFADEITFWSKSLAARPQSPTLHARLASALLARGRVAEAERLFKGSLDANPANLNVRLQLGRVYASRGKWDVATEHYRLANRLDPENPAPFEYLGDVLIGRGQVESGMTAYRTAVELAQRRSRPTPAPLIKIGCVLSHLQRWDEARAAYEHAIMIEPACASGHMGLANLDFRLQDWSASAGHVQRALAVDLADPAVLSNLGLMLGALGEFEKAEVVFARALRSQPVSADTANNIGVSLAGRGQMNGAIFFFRKALSLDPQHRSANNNLRNAEQAKSIESAYSRN